MDAMGTLRTPLRRQIQTPSRRPWDKAVGPGLASLAPNGPCGSPGPHGQGLSCLELQLRWLFQGLAPGAAPLSHVIPTFSTPKNLMFGIDRYAR